MLELAVVLAWGVLLGVLALIIYEIAFILRPGDNPAEPPSSEQRGDEAATELRRAA
ncbi:hypothetical protein [Flaviflagellibacter deserti]|jgi:hypothetical protein|uniref:Uncharacterized protein n=1 Tax=Flaviflagellibacter deserti TaxID=2267266 RepID=A0ABV9Z011_9HYPH